jgi:hypothetical protein
MNGITSKLNFLVHSIVVTVKYLSTVFTTSEILIVSYSLKKLPLKYLFLKIHIFLKALVFSI